MADGSTVSAEAVEFPLGFETVRGAFRGQCRLDSDGLTLLYGGDVHLSVKWAALHAADGGDLHPYRPNKVALDVSPTDHAKPLLLKLYIDRLSDVEQLVQFMGRHTKVRLRPGYISSLLHSPVLLPYYSHPLRRALWAVKQFYGFVLKLALILYVTNLVAVLPDVSLADAYTSAVAAMRYVARVPKTPQQFAVLCLLPFLGPALLTYMPLALALVAARHCVTILLSLAILQDVHHILRLYRELVRLLAYARSLTSSLKRSEKKFQ
eukprot:EG_transcript_19166